MRAALAAVLLLVFPAAAPAAVTRPVQAVDGIGTHYWVPNALEAQQGDTIQWRFTQPGNPAAAQHDVWIVAPGGSPAQVGAQYQGATAQTAVSQVGTYQFYCSIHGGLAPGGMNGTITVGADDPGPPSDPGEAWKTSPPPVTGPAPAINTFSLPPVFERGDTTPPEVTILSVTGVRRGARVRVRVSESGTVTIRMTRGSKTLVKRRVRVKAGRTKSVTVRLRSRVHTERVRLRVTAKDAAQLESTARSAPLWVGD